MYPPPGVRHTKPLSTSRAPWAVISWRWPEPSVTRDQLSATSVGLESSVNQNAKPPYMPGIAKLHLAEAYSVSGASSGSRSFPTFLSGATRLWISAMQMCWWRRRAP